MRYQCPACGGSNIATMVTAYIDPNTHHLESADNPYYYDIGSSTACSDCDEIGPLEHFKTQTKETTP